MPNEHTIAENLQRLVDAKTAIANAITAKGGTVGQNDGLEEFPTAINGISTGVDTSNDTVTPATLAEGVTAHNAAGEQITGTMQGGLEMNVKFTTGNKTIPNYMFYNNHGSGKNNSSYSIEEVVIGDSVTSIGAAAFSACTSLTSAIIGNGVTSINNYAFVNCSLTSINIPNSVTTIGAGVFNGCTSLTSAIIGNGITSIGSDAFYNCTNLTTIIIDKPQDSVSGAPWYATNATVVWTG